MQDPKAIFALVVSSALALGLLVVVLGDLLQGNKVTFRFADKKARKPSRFHVLVYALWGIFLILRTAFDTLTLWWRIAWLAAAVAFLGYSITGLIKLRRESNPQGVGGS